MKGLLHEKLWEEADVKLGEADCRDSEKQSLEL